MAGPSVDQLFPAIAQSFAVIIIGYIFGFFKIVPVKESRSIGILVGKLALPALLFKNLAILNLSAISWSFLGGMLIAKFSLFAVVALITTILSRPFNIGKGGILGIFVTQSNDFALGLPIVQALYQQTSVGVKQFDYVSYIYLLAPISLAIINPVGFTFMEFQKQFSTKGLNMKQVPRIIFRTLKGVIFNPVIFMTVLGLIVNLIVTFGLNKTDPNEKIPSWLGGFLDILGSAYAACALFNIGIFMVGKIKNITLNLIFVAMLLIVAKTILLPMVAYRTVYTLVPNDAYNGSSKDDIATFGFLMGTFPTAPTVFVFASQYHVAMEIVATSLVLCTFLSAPIMYITARMVLIPNATIHEYHDIIADVQLDVSIITMISVVLIFIIFILTKRYRSYMHVFVMHIMAAMLLEVIGIITQGYVTSKGLLYWEYFCFGLFFIGVLSTRTWMASIGIGMVMLLIKGQTLAEKAWIPLMLGSWGIPVTITILLVSICAANESKLHKNQVDVSFLFGQVQLIISLIILVISFVVATLCIGLIIFLTRRIQKANRNQADSLVRETSTSSNNMKLKYARHSPIHTYQNATLDYTSNEGEVDSKTTGVIFVNNGNSSNLTLQDEDTISDGEKKPLLKDYEKSQETSDYVSEDAGLWFRDLSRKHLIRFLILLILLVFSSLVGILIVIWKMLTKEISGVFIAINVLDTITNFGQGFFILIVFGLEKHLFLMVLYKKIRGLLFKIETVIIPPKEELDMKTLSLCSTFKDQFLEQCKEDIVTEKKYCFTIYPSVFTGSELVSWLVDQGIVASREDGVEYGQSLMFGQCLAHIHEEHYFHDESYFYQFL